MDDARLLLVEDNEEIAQMLVLFLSARGYKVYVAYDGATALTSVREFLPNLILLDVGLPDLDGYTLLQRFRNSLRTRYIPAIFLTQRNKKHDRLIGLQLGADDFISKPFDLEELLLRIQNAVVRAARENLSDPVTGLPAGRVVREEMQAARKRPDRVITEFQLRHLSDFRDQYGLLAGVDLLRYTALLMNRVLNQMGSPDDFLGQLHEDVYIAITDTGHSEAVRRAICERFENDAVQHYGLGEKQGLQVRVRTPSGQERILPLMTLEARTL